MNCDLVQTKLMDYLYEELSSEERTAFDVHLSGCEACSEALHELGETRSILSRLKEDPMPGLLQADDIIKPVSKGATPVSIRWKSYLSMAAAAVFGAFLWSLMQGFSIHVSDGQFSVAFGAQATSASSEQRGLVLTEEERYALLTQMKTENVQLMREVLTGYQREQLTEINKLMASYAMNIEEEQNRKLQVVHRDLELLYRNAQHRFMQTDQQLSSLFQTVSYSPR